MAKFELKFLDNDYVERSIDCYANKSLKTICLTIIDLEDNKEMCIYLDKSTSIKFSKTLRTEINKITEEEVNNG